ncbi:hypothetical protein pb186bvf_020939 [Paramecium bursaria]
METFKYISEIILQKIIDNKQLFQNVTYSSIYHQSLKCLLILFIALIKHIYQLSDNVKQTDEKYNVIIVTQHTESKRNLYQNHLLSKKSIFVNMNNKFSILELKNEVQFEK